MLAEDRFIMHSNHPHFQPIERIRGRVETLLSQLTLDEKITLLGGHHKEGQTLAVERLGIPHFRMADGPVGIHWWCQQSTAYPASITLASTWDRKLSYRLGKSLGRDCRARGVHILLAPGVNLYRSALCGRNFEYLGEDPILAAELVTQEILGLQDQGVAATVKHYALNNQEFDRNDVSSDADERTIREVYLPAFEAAIIHGGAGCLMTGYNLVNGTHCSQHDWLLNEVLRNEWGFDGVVMSDWVSVYHTAGAILGGLDLEMPTAKYFAADRIHKALEQGLITEEAINVHTRRLLTLGAAFGWLDHPQQDESIPWDDPSSCATALDISRAGIVLLKNEESVLPLDVARVKKVVLVGHHGGQPVICGGGSAYTPPYHTTTLLEGLKSVAPQVEFSYFPMVDLNVARKAYTESEFIGPDGLPGLRGAYYNNLNASGTPLLVKQDLKIDFYWTNANKTFTDISSELDPHHFSVRWTGSFVPKTDGEYTFYMQSADANFRFLLDGELVADSTGLGLHFNAACPRALKAGQTCGIEIIFLKELGRDHNQVYFGVLNNEEAKVDYANALEAIRSADLAIVSAGYTAQTEGEAHDRAFGIGTLQNQLILDVAQANPQTVVALYAGGNVDMTRWIDPVKGLLYLWYPGQDGALAAAEILFGKTNPSGKLPATFEKHVEDRSSFDSYLDSDRDKRVFYEDGLFTGYRHHDRKGHAPRFPFGFGLSYTTFDYKNLRLSKSTLKAGEVLEVLVDVTNTGLRAGAEVVQIYVHDEKASVVRPVKELKGFEKIDLAPGETKTVTVNLPARAFQFWHPDRKEWLAEPGVFEILVASSATEIRLTQKIEMI